MKGLKDEKFTKQLETELMVYIYLKYEEYEARLRIGKLIEELKPYCNLEGISKENFLQLLKKRRIRKRKEQVQRNFRCSECDKSYGFCNKHRKQPQPTHQNQARESVEVAETPSEEQG